MFKKVKIKYSLGEKERIFELGGIANIEEFKSERLKSYGNNAQIVEVADDHESAMWAEAYEQDKNYNYNG
jgi:hypothetical protein